MIIQYRRLIIILYSVGNDHVAMILYSTKYSRDKEFMVFMVTANFPANFMMLGQLRIRNSM